MTGSVIAIATLTLFAVVSEPVRELLKGTQELERHNAELQETIQEKQREIQAQILQLQNGRIVFGVGAPILMFTFYPGVGNEPPREQVASALSLANLEALSQTNKVATENTPAGYGRRGPTGAVPGLKYRRF